jgi:hypothetical protein
MTRTSAVPAADSVLAEGGHLNEPLGMLAPNGNIVATNGCDGHMVEITPQGKQVAVQTADKKTGPGSLFGVEIAPERRGIYSSTMAKTRSTSCTETGLRRRSRSPTTSPRPAIEAGGGGRDGRVGASGSSVSSTP